MPGTVSGLLTMTLVQSWCSINACGIKFPIIILGKTAKLCLWVPFPKAPWDGNIPLFLIGKEVERERKDLVQVT